ncbi:MAG: HDOD domain-containing protein [Planctomycetales bacterium]|nr:HDOD domain-containing protein [Planctomycetales bacterium]
MSMTSAVLEEVCTTTANPPEELRSRLLAKGDKLQMVPDVAMKALALAKDPRCSIAEFASVVERDVKLAADILKITNSAFYGARHPILNLRQAVVRLGFAHCRNVILAASLGSMMKRMPLSEAWLQTVLWRHAVLTGTLSVKLNQTLKLGFDGEEFTAGLIHDVGRSLIGVVAPNHLSAADPLDFEESPEMLLRERDILRTDHCELGAWFMAHSKLPSTLVEVVKFHHNPVGATKENVKLVALTAVADDMANYLQRSDTADGYDPEQNFALDVLFGGDPARRRQFVTEAVDMMELVSREANSTNQPFGLS